MTDTTEMGLDELLDEKALAVPIPDAFVPLAEAASQLRDALSKLHLDVPGKSDPADLPNLVDLREFVLATMDPLKQMLARIDALWLRAYMRTGATKFPVGKGFVTIEEPPVRYQVDDHALRGELMRFVHDGLITRDEAEKAIGVQTVYKVDNRVLNTLARNRGTEVRDTIEKHRRKIERDPADMHIRYPLRTNRTSRNDHLVKKVVA